ncbi:MAG: hypothetical protein HeimC2_35100, partial [Candidatus Heimdallarchaeota archaeon LC_2]
LIQYEGGIYDGGVSEFFGEFFKNGYLSEGDRQSYVNNILTLGLVAVSMIFLAIFFRENQFLNRFMIIPTLIYGYTSTILLQRATNNYIIMFINIFYITGLFFYWMKYGEFVSFFENRLIIFTLKRSLAIIPLFLAISIFTFFGINFIGNPVALATGRIRVGKQEKIKILLIQYGFTDSSGNEIAVWRRYIIWINDFIHGDLGRSFQNGAPVTDNINRFLWETLKMQALALIIAFILSVIVGIIAAYYHRSTIDTAISAFALLGLSMPIFVTAILAILIFGGFGLDWFPVAGAHGLDFELAQQCEFCDQKPGNYFTNNFSDDWATISFWTTSFEIWWVYTRDSLNHLVLPVLTLTFASMATFSRLTRSTMLEVMRQDYILAARANGLSEFTVVGKHALRNVLLPLVTFLGISVGFLLAGAPITETVFSWPGMGFYFLTALSTLDIPILMALTMIITLMILFANLIVDVAYTFLDPRISL